MAQNLGVAKMQEIVAYEILPKSSGTFEKRAPDYNYYNEDEYRATYFE